MSDVEVLARKISAGHYALHLRPMHVVWERDTDGTYFMVTLAQETDMVAVCDGLREDSVASKGYTISVSLAGHTHAIQAAFVAQTPSGTWCSKAVFPIESHLYSVSEQESLEDVLAVLRARVAMQDKGTIRIPF